MVLSLQPKDNTYCLSRVVLCCSSCCCSVTQSCPTLCYPIDCSMPGFPVHRQLSEFAQTHIHRVGDTIQPFHPLSYPSLPAFSLSQHQGFFPMSQFFTSGGQNIGVSPYALKQNYSPHAYTLKHMVLYS